MRPKMWSFSRTAIPAAATICLAVGALAPYAVTAQQHLQLYAYDKNITIIRDGGEGNYHVPQPQYQPPPPPPPVVKDPPRIDPIVNNPIFVPPVQTQLDVTKPPVNTPIPASALPSMNSLIGVVPDNKFLKDGALQGDGKGILVKNLEGADFSKVSPCVVKLDDGSILVGVHKPTETGMVTTPLGDIAVSSNSAAILKFQNGVLRVMNMSACNAHLKARLDKDLFSEGKQRIVTIAPGCELVASDTKLGRSELRPDDGVSRRRCRVLETGQLAVNEFSSESVLQSTGLIAKMANSNESKERGLFKDLSKMAAVLNYVNGTQGFQQSNVGLAQKTLKPGDGSVH